MDFVDENHKVSSMDACVFNPTLNDVEDLLSGFFGSGLVKGRKEAQLCYNHHSLFFGKVRHSSSYLKMEDIHMT